jgi:beta-barrel assembly-enhancing protease
VLKDIDKVSKPDQRPYVLKQQEIGMRRKQQAVAAMLLLMVVAAAPVLARKPGEKLKPGFNVFSREQDVQLGQEAAAEISKQVQVVDNPALQQYVRRLGERLAATPSAKEGGFPFQFTVINDPAINAFALPGGPMFIHTGLLKAADNEAQLVGVLGHEMAHVILRHGTNQASKQNLIALPAMLASAMSGKKGGLLGTLSQLGIGLSANSVLLKFSRSAETEADALGSYIMAEAGYNPVEMARFFEKLEGAGGGGRMPQMLSSHPNPGNRQKSIEAEVTAMPKRQYGYETGQFAQFRQIAAQLPPPPEAKQSPAGAGGGQQQPAPPSTPPSRSVLEFRAPTYSLSHPDNWKAYGNNTDSVTIAPDEGLVKTQNGVAIGLGVVANYYTPENGEINLARNTAALVKSLQQSNPKMRADSRTRNIRVAGYNAMVTMIENESPYGGLETDALVTVAAPNKGVFYMVFIAPSDQYRSVQPAFDQMMNSLRFTR